MTTTAFSYLRFSSAKQAAGDSTRRQTTGFEQACSHNGWTPDDTLQLRDLGVSAFKGDNAAEGKLGAFLKAIETGRVKPGSVLVVECLDRLSRQRARHALKVVEKIIDAGVTVHSTMDGTTYTATSLDDNGGMQLVMMILTFSAITWGTSKLGKPQPMNADGTGHWTTCTAKKPPKPLPTNCPHCGSGNLDARPGKGPHVGELFCADCDRGIKWLPQEQYDQLTA